MLTEEVNTSALRDGDIVRHPETNSERVVTRVEKRGNGLVRIHFMEPHELDSFLCLPTFTWDRHKKS